MTARSVLIASCQDWAGLSRIPRFLAAAGAAVDAFAPADSKLSWSSRVSQVFPGPEDPDRCLDLLKTRLASGKAYDWVLLGDDALVHRAIDRRSEAWIAPLLPARGEAPLRAIGSKAEFGALLAATGIAAPSGGRAEGLPGALAVASAVGYPVIVKPERGWSGTGVFSAATPAELERRFDPARGGVLVQRLVEGRVGATTVLFDRGRPAWWTSYLKVGVWPEPFGPSCRRLPTRPPGLEELLKTLGAAMKLNGLLGIDWILTPAGSLSLIELNARPTPMAELGSHVNDALPAALSDFLDGRDAVRRPPADQEVEVWHAMPASWLLARARGERALAARLLCGAGVKTDAPWGDRGLLLRHAAGVARAVSLELAVSARRSTPARPS